MILHLSVHKNNTRNIQSDETTSTNIKYGMLPLCYDMLHPNLFSITMNITFSGSALPPFPINPNNLHILYQPNSMHYSTLLPLHDNNLRT